MEKLNKRKMREIIIEELRNLHESGTDDKKFFEDVPLHEDFTRSEKRELSRLIRNELVQVFYDLYKKRSFWT